MARKFALKLLPSEPSARMQHSTNRFCVLIFFLLSLFIVHDAVSQVQSKRTLRKNKRSRINIGNRQATFSGARLPFANAKQYITLGVSANALNYFGDIVPQDNILSTDIAYTRPGLGISSTARLGPAFSVRAEFMYGRVSSSDFAVADPENEEARPRYVRNLQFRNNIKDLSLIGMLDLFPNTATVSLRMRFTPYVFAGVSVFHHNPQGKVPEQAIFLPAHLTNPFVPAQAGEWVALKPLQTEGPESTYSNFQISIPVGGGVRFRINNWFDVEAEVSYRYLFTDHLDDVSGHYVDKGLLDSDLAKVMSDRSLEPVDVISGDPRAIYSAEGVLNRNVSSYIGADGVEYVHLGGYGQPHESAIRGNAGDNDIFITTTVRVVMMLARLNLSGGIRAR